MKMATLATGTDPATGAEPAIQILARAARIYGPIMISENRIVFKIKASLGSFEAVMVRLFRPLPHTAHAYERIVRATLVPAARQFG